MLWTITFDRIVHFCYGLLMAYPLREVMLRVVKLKGFWAYAFTVTILLATGAFYELIEMWAALIVAPEIGTLLLGTQGDPWDTQHDMAAALYGATMAMIITVLVKKIRRLD
jgi:putative membrane protein